MSKSVEAEVKSRIINPGRSLRAALAIDFDTSLRIVARTVHVLRRSRNDTG